MKNDFYKLLILKSFLVLSIGATYASSVGKFESPIFEYADPEHAVGLSCRLAGTSAAGFDWSATSVNLTTEIGDFTRLFGNETVMKQFAGGSVKDDVYTRSRLIGWDSRQRAGQPHSGMTIRNDNEEFLGHVVAGGGDGPGVSEVAYSLLPAAQGQKIMSSVVNSIVTVWAPEVQALAEHDNEFVRTAFSCFSGEPLKRLDATASPNNIGSWKVLEKNGFIAAISRVEEAAAPIADLSSDGDLRLEDVEGQLLPLWDASSSASPLQAGIRYTIIGIDGREFTVSKHTRYDSLKFHFENNLN